MSDTPNPAEPKRAPRALPFQLIATGLVLATLIGIGFATDGDSGATTNTVDPTAPVVLQGRFLVSGSSTVFPIVDRQVEAFAAANPGASIAVEGPGSGDGAVKFCDPDQSVPIGNASRTYKDEELAECEANGIGFVELRRAIDGISVITSADNDLIDCLSFNQLYALLGGESTGTVENWSDANAILDDMGAAGADLPDVRLDVFGPGGESGTFDSFGEIVIESVAKGKTGLDADAREFSEDIRLDYNASPDDNVLIQGINGSQYSLGWVGYAFAQEAADEGLIKLVPITKDDGGECVTPNPETIASAQFPIARFLYSYVREESATNDPLVQALVDYMLSDEGLEAVSAVGYIDLEASQQAEVQATWANRSTGRQWEE